jgi:hypothetical protein
LTYSTVWFEARIGAAWLMPRTVMLLLETDLLGSGSAPVTSEKQNGSGSVSGVVALERIGVCGSGGQILGVRFCGAQAKRAAANARNTKFFMARIVLENGKSCSLSVPLFNQWLKSANFKRYFPNNKKSM